MNKKTYLRLSYDRWEDGNGWTQQDSILEIEEQNRTAADIEEEVNSADDIGYIARIWISYITGDGYVDLLDNIDDDGNWTSSTETVYNVEYWQVELKYDIGEPEEPELIGAYSFSDRNIATYLWGNH